MTTEIQRTLRGKPIGEWGLGGPVRRLLSYASMNWIRFRGSPCRRLAAFNGLSAPWRGSPSGAQSSTTGAKRQCLPVSLIVSFAFVAFPIPPPSAKCLQERRGVGVAIRARLREIQDGLVVRLLGGEECQVAGQAQLHVVASGFQAVRARLRGLQVGVTRVGIELQRRQSVSDILESRQHDGAILRAGGIEGRGRGTPLVDQRAARKQRLGQAYTHIPKRVARGE